MVFETLGLSIYDLIKRNDYVGFPMAVVKIISRQLLGAMDFLKSMNLIHTDLKLENILFKSTTQMKIETVNWYGRSKSIQIPVNLAIKIIDFGGATFDNESKSTIINTRQYRSPEVTLEAGWSFPSDMWSTGCMIAEIYGGELFFQTHDDLEHLALMERCVGLFPFSLLERSKRDRKYFHRNGYVRFEELPADGRNHVRSAFTVREFFTIHPDDDRSGIIELMYGLFELEPRRRLTAREALALPFFEDSRTAARSEQGRDRDTGRDSRRGDNSSNGHNSGHVKGDSYGHGNGHGHDNGIREYRSDGRNDVQMRPQSGYPHS